MKYQFRKQPACNGSKLAEIPDGSETSEDSDDPENAVKPLETDTSDSEADQPLIKFQSFFNKKLLWKDDDPNIDIGEPILEKWTIKDVGEPSSYFEPYFSKTWIDSVCQQSNKYARGKDIESKINLTPILLRKFLGCSLFMSLYGMANVRRYWNSNTRIPQIVDVLTLNEFESVKNCLHIGDNDLYGPNFKRDFKFASIVESFN